MRDSRSPSATGFERTPRKMAAEAGIEIEFVHQRNLRKADRVKERRARWGEPPGLLCIFSARVLLHLQALAQQENQPEVPGPG